MNRILLVDDDQSVLDVLVMAFEDEGFEVTSACDGQQALVSIANTRPDVMISDVNMPKLDGFSVCRRLREEGDDLPIILLTSRDNDIDEALGLELGADDFVAKPFSTRVLIARVKALLRRQELKKSDGPRDVDLLELGAIRIDPDTMDVQLRGESLSLTVTEFRLVEAFVRRPGIVLSRDRLMELARGDDSIVADRIVDTYVRRLRRKFETIDASFDRIETVIGAGYRWKR